MPSEDADRLDHLRAVKLRALVSSRWSVPDDAVASTFPTGSALRSAYRLWVLAEGDPTGRLGAVLALAIRRGATAAELLVNDPVAASVLARRAALFDLPVGVWLADGASLRPVDAAAPARDEAPAPAAELYRPLLESAGLEAVVEGGVLRGELAGLEVARVEVDEAGTARLFSGVGSADREIGAMVRADMSEAESLETVLRQVRPLRRPGTPMHRMNQLVRERWLRSLVVADPAMVGAATLRPVGSAVPRRNLTENGVATAIGTDAAGAPMVVTCSTGVNLDLVPAAADDRLANAPGARLVLVLGGADVGGVTRDLAAQLREPAELVVLDDDWAATASPEVHD